MRLRHRIRVDFPQPEGPISAVISLRAMSKLTPRTAGLGPYETCTSLNSKIASRCLSGAAACVAVIRGGLVRSGVSTCSSSCLSWGSVTRSTFAHLPLLLVSIS
jgi:hypothetical protein